MDGLGALVPELFSLGGQSIALLPKIDVLDEALVVETLESVGLFILIRLGGFQLIVLRVALLLPGGDFFQEGEGGGEEGVPV